VAVVSGHDAISGVRVFRAIVAVVFAVQAFVFSQRPKLIKRKYQQKHLADRPFQVHVDISGYDAAIRYGGLKNSGA
jgi:hypothetical protein